MKDSVTPGKANRHTQSQAGRTLAAPVVYRGREQKQDINEGLESEGPQPSITAQHRKYQKWNTKQLSGQALQHG